MKIFLAGWMVLGIALFTFFPISNTVTANVDVPNNEPTSLTETSQSPNIYVFGRDECGFCKALFTYLTEEEIPFTYLNIVTDKHAKSLYDQVTEKHNISKV
ncbi:MAG: hypothetical protein ABL927_12360, partial [Bdellovibrionales bacterium]